MNLRQESHNLNEQFKILTQRLWCREVMPDRQPFSLQVDPLRR